MKKEKSESFRAVDTLMRGTDARQDVGGGTYIYRSKISPKDFECRYCLYFQKQQCTLTECMYLDERICAGGITKTVILEAICKDCGEVFRRRCQQILEGGQAKLRSVEWDVEQIHGELYGRITAHLTEAFTEDEESRFLDWVSGQNADGLGEGFEQRAIPTGDGNELYVHLWNWDDSYFLCREDQLDEHTNHHKYGMGEMTL